MLKLKQLSSLVKVFPDKIYGKASKRTIALGGESVSFQVAYWGEGEYTLKIKSELKDYIEVYKVGYVPSSMPAYPQCDDGFYERREPGLFPDPLIPLKGKIKAEATYNSLFITVNTPKIKGGVYPIELCFNGKGEKYTVTHEIKVAKACIEEREIIFTEWFHTDCIADVHKKAVWSQEHWDLIGKYLKMATDHGINTILVPVLTPPLDTAVGGERTTVQLVDISLENGEYKFNFEKLHKFINLAKEMGVRYFEINHMFTQWGAAHAPKVIATVNGEQKRIFGWETDSYGDDYAEFLRALIPALICELEKAGLTKDQVFFHASDEPSESCLEVYKKASSVLKPLIKGYKLIDALSHLEFYNQGLVEIAVCGINDIEPFIEAKVSGLWGYYCCAQSMEVSNRFFGMPSYRNRIIGTQIYKFGLNGFLHWGYNFYNSRHSVKKINPYKVTDAGGAFPSGDAFSVYPYRNGVIPSIRLKVFKEALDDVSMLYMVERKIGKEATIALIEEVAGQEITFKSYPHDAEFSRKLRERIIKIL